MRGKAGGRARDDVEIGSGVDEAATLMLDVAEKGRLTLPPPLLPPPPPETTVEVPLPVGAGGGTASVAKR